MKTGSWRRSPGPVGSKEAGLTRGAPETGRSLQADHEWQRVPPTLRRCAISLARTGQPFCFHGDHSAAVSAIGTPGGRGTPNGSGFSRSASHRLGPGRHDRASAGNSTVGRMLTLTLTQASRWTVSG